MLRRLAGGAFLGITFLTNGALAQAPVSEKPWMNSALPPDARADLVLAEMTQSEELLLVKGYYGANARIPWTKPAPNEFSSLLPGTAGFVPGIDRLGVPALHETDAGVGIANTNQMRPDDRATAFPSGLSNAATWNPDLAFSVGAAIAAEARDRGFNVVLDGALNLAREPRGGRTFEYAGEDPLLAGTIAGEQVRGIQSAHVISTVKHFALNDQETGRGVLNAAIDEAAARESDLLAFEIAIEHGDPGAVMCAYNRVNTSYACENEFLLNHVLKRDWSYAGWVLSDWGAVHSTAAAANAGLDQESASGFDREEYFGTALLRALSEGTVSEARLHDMVHRILRTMFDKGLMDFPMTPHEPSEHRTVAEHSAAEGIVLLKNEGGTLPLVNTIRSIAVIGGHADVGMLSGGGSSQVLPLGYSRDSGASNNATTIPLGRKIYDPPSPVTALRQKMPQATVVYDDGGDIERAVRLAQHSDIVIVFVEQWMTEGQDVPNLSLPDRQDELIEAVAAANSHVVVVLETGGPVLMPWLARVPAVLEAWYAGSGGASALAQILFGDINPSGRLPISFPDSEGQLPRPDLSRKDRRDSFDVDYLEGADVGYRWFELKEDTPLFPFGFGLSYTTFALNDLHVTGGESVTASINVANTGAHEGSATVQIYATPPPLADSPASARLIGWSKVHLMPGEARTISIATEPRLLARFDQTANVWRISPGVYAISAGASATDIKATASISIPERTIKP